MVKAVVDIRRKMMVIGGELHSDEEALLLENGSDQHDVWGININPFSPETERIEFNSLINIRPKNGNFSRNVEDISVKEIIINIVNNLVRDD